MHVLLCLTCNPVSKGAGQKDWRWGLGECPFEVNPGSPEIQRGSGMNRDRDFIRIPAARETWNWKGGGWSRGFYKHRNSKLNLTWQAALTKVSRHSGDDSLRALVFYFYIYIYIYTQPWWLVAGVDNEKVVESPPKGGDQHLVNKTQPLTWTMTDNYKNTKMVTIKWIFLQQEKRSVLDIQYF